MVELSWSVSFLCCFTLLAAGTGASRIPLESQEEDVWARFSPLLAALDEEAVGGHARGLKDEPTGGTYPPSYPPPIYPPPPPPEDTDDDDQQQPPPPPPEDTDDDDDDDQQQPPPPPPEDADEDQQQPPPPPELPVDDTPQTIIDDTDAAPAGTGADEALSSITRSRMPINNAPFTDAEGNVDLGAKAAFSQDMINRSGIPQGGLGRRKGPSTQSQHEGLRSTANNMLEDALETAPSATAGNIQLFVDAEQENDIGIEIRLFYPEGTPAATRSAEASNAGARLAQNANSPRYTEGVKETVQESGAELGVDVTPIVEDIEEGRFAETLADSIESEAVDEGAFVLKSGMGAVLASVGALLLLV